MLTIKKYSFTPKIKPHIYILVVFCLAHWFMLVLTGTFWDDWCYFWRDANQIQEVALQTGRPEWSVLLPAVWELPWYGYRKLTFLVYLLCAFLFYNILKRSEFFSENEILMITLIYIVIPVNDARVLLSNFVYAVGLCCFLFAFNGFILWDKLVEKRYRLFFRVFLWLLFGASFILNSILSLYYSIFIFLLFDRLSKVKENINVKKIISTLVLIIRQFWDFLILPVVFFVVKDIYFPVYGRYEHYNQVQGMKVCVALIKMPIVIVKTCFGVIGNLLSNCSISMVIASIIVFLLLCILAKLGGIECTIEKKHVLLKCLAGLSILFLGLFPYETIRMGNEVATYGTGGRDAILFPLGFSILLVSLISCFDIRKQKVIVIGICALGVVNFNSVYFTWQEDYYKQLAMINELSENLFVKENNTFYMINESQTSLDTQRFYTLAWNSYMAFGDQSRIYVCSSKEIEMLKDKKRLDQLVHDEPRLYGVNDYNLEDTSLDAVLDFKAIIGKGKMIKLKMLEIFSKEHFEQTISDVGNLTVFPVSKEVFKNIVQ